MASKLPKPAEALAKASEDPKGSAVVKLFPKQPAYLRYPNPDEYRLHQYGIQRAQLEANKAAAEALKFRTPQQQASNNTWTIMPCPWSLSGRQPKP